VLGICTGKIHGAQLGGEVEGGHHREFGRADVEVKAGKAACSIHWAGASASGLDEPWRPHHQMPPGFVVAGVSANAPFAVIQDETRKILRADVPSRSLHTPTAPN